MLREANVIQEPRELDHCVCMCKCKSVDGHGEVDLSGIEVRAVDGALALFKDGESIQSVHRPDIAQNQKLKSVEITDIFVEADSQATTITIRGGLISPSVHTLLGFEVEGSGLHYGGHFMLHPYDSQSACQVACRLLANGQFKDASASMNSVGEVTIILYGISVHPDTDDLHIHYLSYLN